MAPRFNLFDPNLLPPNFLGGIAGNPSEVAPDPVSGYTPLLDPVILGGVGGSDPVRSDVPQNIADFYGGILNIGQPDAGYFDEFRLPGDDRVMESGPNLTVANPTDVTDTRVPFDPNFYTELAQAIGGNRGGYDDTEMMNRLADMQATIDGFTSSFTPSEETNNQLIADPSDDPFTPPSTDFFIPPVDAEPDYVRYDDSFILDELAKLRDRQDSFVPQEPAFIPTYDDTTLRTQIGDLQNQLANLPAVDTSQFITANDLPTFTPFDPTGLQAQIDDINANQFLTANDLPTFTPFDPTGLQDQITALQGRPTVDTSQFLTANDLPTFEQFDPTGLQQQINALQARPSVDTSQFLTASDLPTFEQFDPTGLQQQINDLQSTPAIDTSQFLTAADLPSYDVSALENEIAELRAQLNRNTNSTPALTTPTFSGILPRGGFNVR